ncbi:hypothetical protein [Flavivirga jejuensis]|uniref:Uncharacterized protein n=1 Tax=Flavivirga jejuensis TaxID=870487 RepID=A0ABT8WTE6_9FLAO|nr:hypothetical protein [Flavivirga jejuensis]MDO5976122.1 hypothetical protein [Flavivirga jejuensis]
MNKQIKITIIWSFIGLGLGMHSLLEQSEAIFFKPLLEEPISAGIPPFAHVIYILAMIFPMIMAFLHLFYTKKGFLIFSMVYAGLLSILNIFHVIETLMVNIGNISQIILLLFVAIANIALIFLLNKYKKEVILPN